jgi:hypothetical protein
MSDMSYWRVHDAACCLNSPASADVGPPGSSSWLTNGLAPRAVRVGGHRGQRRAGQAGTNSSLWSLRHSVVACREHGTAVKGSAAVLGRPGRRSGRERTSVTASPACRSGHRAAARYRGSVGAVKPLCCTFTVRPASAGPTSSHTWTSAWCALSTRTSLPGARHDGLCGAWLKYAVRQTARKCITATRSSLHPDLDGLVFRFVFNVDDLT